MDATAQTKVKSLAEIAARLREEAAALDDFAIALAQEQGETILLPEFLEQWDQDKTEEEPEKDKEEKTIKKRRTMARPPLQPQGPVINPRYTMLTGGRGAGGYAPYGAGQGAPNWNIMSLLPLLMGGSGGGSGLGGLASLLGGGGGSGLGGLASLLGGSGGGNAQGGLASLLGGSGGGKDGIAQLLSLLNQKDVDLNDLLKDPEKLKDLFEQKESSDQETKSSEADGDEGEKEEKTESKNGLQILSDLLSNLQGKGKNQQPAAETQSQNPAGQGPGMGNFGTMGPRGQRRSGGVAFTPNPFSFSATRAIRTPTAADAQYLDALLQKWQVF